MCLIEDVYSTCVHDIWYVCVWVCLFLCAEVRGGHCSLPLHLVLETGLPMTLALAWRSARSASRNSPVLAPQSAVVRSMCVSTSCL